MGIAAATLRAMTTATVTNKIMRLIGTTSFFRAFPGVAPIVINARK